jgi:hypothetical protein
MIPFHQAKQIIQSHLASISRDLEPDAAVIVESATIERAFGWVFFYQSREYLKSGSIRHALAGNAPLIVDRLTGDIVATGTTHPIEHYLAEYEAPRNRSDT